MSDNMDFDVSLDDILAEFASSATGGTPPKNVEKEPAPAEKKYAPTAPPPAASAPAAPPPLSQPKAPLFDPIDIDLSVPPAPVTPPAPTVAERRAAPGTIRTPASNPAGRFSGEEFEELFGSGAGVKKGVPQRRSAAAPERAQDKRRSPDGAQDKRRSPVKTEASPEKRSKTPERAADRQPPLTPPPEKAKGPTGILLGAFFVILALVVLCCTTILIHPSSNSASNTASGTTLDLLSKLDVYMNNASADALGDLAYIKKLYKLDENVTVAPKPNPSAFGTVAIADSAKILDVIQKARDSGLLEEQEVIFDPNVEFDRHSDIQYYCDDTILVICWKEIIDGNTCSCVEIKIADPSQFRRKIADDTYGSTNQYYASTMYNQTNAVVAMNADFYQFRNFGIVAYQRQLYRYNDANYTGMYSMYNCIDNLFVTSQGEFLFMHKGDPITEDEVRQFMVDNDVLFTIAFGPVLVEDGVVQTCDWYPAGQPNTGYSRAGIGVYDNLHYLYMSLNHSNDKQARWTVNQFAQHISEKGVYDAYGLDGGQTSEIVFQGVPYNYIDFDAERMVSDIIYFATAIPEEEATP